MHKADPLAENHKQIWLEPICCVDERCWSEDPQPCDDCDLPPVKYIRADIAEAEIERLRAALAKIYSTLSATAQGRGTETFEIARAALPHHRDERAG